MAKKNENIAEETVKKTTKKAKTEGEAVEKTEEEIAAEIDVQLRTSEHRSMYSYVRLSIDRCTATYV